MSTTETVTEIDPKDAQTLKKIAMDVANSTCNTINQKAFRKTVVTPTMPYKAQFILEEVIRILQERV